MLLLITSDEQWCSRVTALTAPSRNQGFRLNNGKNPFNDSLIGRNTVLIKPSSSFCVADAQWF